MHLRRVRLPSRRVRTRMKPSGVDGFLRLAWHLAVGDVNPTAPLRCSSWRYFLPRTCAGAGPDVPGWPGAAQGRRTAHAGWVAPVNVLAHREKLRELFSPAGHLVMSFTPDDIFLEHLQRWDIRLAAASLEARRRASPHSSGPRIVPGPGHPVHRPAMLEQGRRHAGQRARMRAG